MGCPTGAGQRRARRHVCLQDFPASLSTERLQNLFNLYALSFHQLSFQIHFLLHSTSAAHTDAFVGHYIVGATSRNESMNSATTLQKKQLAFGDEDKDSKFLCQVLHIFFQHQMGFQSIVGYSRRALRELLFRRSLFGGLEHQISQSAIAANTIERAMGS